MRTAIVWGAFVTILGCGGDSPDISTTEDNVCDQIASVACFDMYQCCSEGEIERLLMVSEPRTVDECHEDFRTLCERRAAQINFSLKNKHLKFDAKIMDACLNSLVAPDECVSVSSMLPWAMTCLETAAWSGIVGNGDACDFANECSTDSFCSNGRVCTALPSDGMPCSIQGCATGLYCGTGICHPLLAQGGACTSTTQCQKGLFCDINGTNTCTPLHAVGETCTGNATCTSSTCLPGTCSGTASTCFTSATCAGRCAGTTVACTADSTCSTGTCSGTNPPVTCFSSAGCVAPSVCVFPVKCEHDPCLGNVCADAHAVVDYCQGAISALPLFRSQVGASAGD
jgi:hypothetical protein